MLTFGSHDRYRFLASRKCANALPRHRRTSVDTCENLTASNEHHRHDTGGTSFPPYGFTKPACSAADHPVYVRLYWHWLVRSLDPCSCRDQDLMLFTHTESCRLTYGTLRTHVTGPFTTQKS